MQRRRNSSKLVMLLLACALSALSAACGTGKGAASASAASSGEVHSTEGTIESFSEDRAVARIHHDTIPGYMKSMVMPFEAAAPKMFDGLSVGDRVELTFDERDDGRRVVRSIKKR